MKTITIQSLSKTYAQPSGLVRAVDEVSLHIEKGEFFFLLGPSGCGKTTLLRMIAGLVEPSAGKVLFGEQDVTNLPVEKRRTAMVFQNYALWPHMTVEKNVQFGPRMKGLDASKRSRICQSNLALVEMENYARRKPNQLSGGQQQRVALARALAAEPDCLLLDEPLSNLDARLRLHMRGELRALVKNTGATAVYVTHDQKEALSMADRVAVMRDGQVIQVGTPEQLYHRPESLFVADFLGEANLLSGQVTGKQGDLVEVKTPLGPIRSTSSSLGDVTCCIRPERVSILPSASTARGNTLPARVESATFLGEIRQYTCSLVQGETSWRVTCLSAAKAEFAAGQKICLHFEPQDVVLLEA